MAVLSFLRSAVVGKSRGQQLVELAQASKIRKDEAALRLSFYHDEQQAELLRDLARQFRDPAKFQLFFVNIVRKITNRLAVVYKEAPARTVVNGTARDQAIAAKIWEQSRIDLAMKKANRYSKLLKTVVVRVAWRNDVIAYDILTPNILDATFEDPEHPDSLLITRPAARPEDVSYTYWTPLEFFTLDARGNLLPNPDNLDNANPYGALPFVPVFDRDPDSEFFLNGGADLVLAQRTINLKLVDLLRNIQSQAWGQPWAKGLGVTKLDFGPETAISLPADGSFGYAQPTAVVTEVIEAVDFLIKQTAICNSLPGATFATEATDESGIAKLVDSVDLREAREDDLELFRTYESRLFEVTRSVWNFHNSNNPISESASLGIDFADLQPAQTETERLDGIKRRIDLGVWSVVDAMMDENPDLKTREDAIRELEVRRVESDTYGPLAGLLNGGTNNGG